MNRSRHLHHIKQVHFLGSDENAGKQKEREKRIKTRLESRVCGGWLTECR